MDLTIKIKTIPPDRGRKQHDVARVYIDGIMFSADITSDIFERQLHRISEKYGADIIDLRNSEG